MSLPWSLHISHCIVALCMGQSKDCNVQNHSLTLTSLVQSHTISVSAVHQAGEKLKVGKTNVLTVSYPCKPESVKSRREDTPHQKCKEVKAKKPI